MLKSLQKIGSLFLFISLISSFSPYPIKAAIPTTETITLPSKQTVHLAVIGALAVSECIALFKQESKIKGVKVNRLLRDLIRILNQFLMVYDHTETSYSAFIPFTYDITNAWTHLTELFAASSEEGSLDQKPTSLNNSLQKKSLTRTSQLKYFNTALKSSKNTLKPKTSNTAPSDEIDHVNLARLKNLYKTLFLTIEIITSGSIALTNDNSPDAQQKRLKLHALASLNRTISELIESDSGSIKADAMAVLLLTNVVTAFLDMEAATEIKQEMRKVAEALRLAETQRLAAAAEALRLEEQRLAQEATRRQEEQRLAQEAEAQRLAQSHSRSNPWPNRTTK